MSKPQHILACYPGNNLVCSPTARCTVLTLRVVNINLAKQTETLDIKKRHTETNPFETLNQKNKQPKTKYTETNPCELSTKLNPSRDDDTLATILYNSGLHTNRQKRHRKHRNKIHRNQSKYVSHYSKNKDDFENRQILKPSKSVIVTVSQNTTKTSKYDTPQNQNKCVAVQYETHLP